MYLLFISARCTAGLSVILEGVLAGSMLSGLDSSSSQRPPLKAT